jgi:hypothetical protein
VGADENGYGIRVASQVKEALQYELCPSNTVNNRACLSDMTRH